MADKFQVGDIVQFVHSDPLGKVRIVYKCDEEYCGSINVDDQPFEISGMNGGPSHAYKKISPTHQLVDWAYKKVKIASEQRRIDNLTFVEIYAKLKQYEQQL